MPLPEAKAFKSRSQSGGPSGGGHRSYVLPFHTVAPRNGKIVGDKRGLLSVMTCSELRGLGGALTASMASGH
jgi:hypothetical protein